MGKILIYQCVLLLAITIAGPAATAGRGTIARSVPALLDSVPAKPVEKPAEKPQEVKPPDIIKEVPKSRRKIKPIAIPAPLPVKPIKIIKPKIIKRTVGLIG